MNKTINSRFNTKTGWLCLDFTNTVSWHASLHPEESLSTYRDLVLWAKSVSIVSPDMEEALVAISEDKPEKARKILDQAIEMREAIYRILLNQAHDIEIKKSDLSILNTAIAKMTPNLQLVFENGSFNWDWTVSVEHLDSVLWPVIWSTVELLTSDALKRVGQCADERGCGWFFWDNSRNRTRRWCDMKDCGNLAKARRHYQKSHNNPQSC